MNNWEAREGSPQPLGVSFIVSEQAWNFSLYSKHAASVTLHLFHPDDTQRPFYSYHFRPLLNKSARIWHCRIAGDVVDDGARYYAYQVDGPHDPQAGHRFNEKKWLLDPYCRAVYFPPGFSRRASIGPGSNAGKAPLGIIYDDPECGCRMQEESTLRHTHDTVIYELHVKGFTQQASSGVSADKRGTFSALVEKIPYLQSLGINTVELMPVFQFDPQENDYWGYMPLSFFALHSQYGCAASLSAVLDEFRAMVQAFHQAGIEVILDVVYNHTGEGNENGPTYSFRGIDNTTYYLLDTHADIFRFFQQMIAIHKAHPSLGRSRFWREDVQWYGVGADVDRSPDSHSLAFYLDGASQDDRNIYVMINAWYSARVILAGSALLWCFAARHSAQAMAMSLSSTVTRQRNTTGVPEGLVCQRP
ncbi:MAG: hypothetical protein L3J88_05030 [Gammaproteobacteria bacterium]|nr:hypothetical protein [Gammaproteobacteria bacterium]MCF6362703.1 hypothetical protein [Gammaproteobacteria bacterium]